MDNFYREIILDHYKNPRNFGKIVNPTSSCKLNNYPCGDQINLSVETTDGKIKNIKFTAVGCAISIAGASILTEDVIGKSVDEVQKMTKDNMLKLLGIQLTPTRLKCALLSLEALHKTLVLVKDK